MGNICQKNNIKTYNNSIPKEEYIKFAPYTYDNSIKQYDKQTEIIARVIDIYDGDTITCCIEENNNFIRKSIRINNLDTCELKNTNKEAKLIAYKARNKVYELITGNSIKLEDLYMKQNDIRKLLNDNVYLVIVKIKGIEKYGRILADINTSNGINISDVLINEKLGYKYVGDTKLTIEEQLKLLK